MKIGTGYIMNNNNEIGRFWSGVYCIWILRSYQTNCFQRNQHHFGKTLDSCMMDTWKPVTGHKLMLWQCYYSECYLHFTLFFSSRYLKKLYVQFRGIIKCKYRFCNLKKEDGDGQLVIVSPWIHTLPRIL